jgi:hypothetical protein
MMQFSSIVFFVYVAAVGLAGCYQTAGYGQALGSQYARGYCGDDWRPCQPSSTYKPRCQGGYADCGYDAARNHTDANTHN